MSANTFVIENEDMSDLCRVCLLLPEESQYLDLTTIYDEEDNLTYAECFTICTQIDLSAGVGVPHHLCKPCGLELQMSYDFHKKVEDSKRVIEQCQRQIKVEKENTCELPAAIKYSKKYVNEEQISAVHGITEKYIITDVEEHLPALSDGPEEDCVVEGENEQGFVAPSYVNEETDEIEVMNIECHSETNLLNQVQSQPHNSSLIEVMNENDEDNIEMDDYQNMETLEEGNGAENSSTLTSITGVKFQDFDTKNHPDIEANLSRTLPDEPVIVEEISQDTTHEWLDSFSDTLVQCVTNDEITVAQKVEAAAESADVNETLTKSGQPGNDLIKTAKKVECTCCGKSFISKNKLSWHMRMHDKNRKRFICPAEQCGRIYASRQSYDQHYKRTHMDAGVVCEICQKTFSAKQTLEVHMRYHTKEFPYQCNLCPRKFVQKGHLTQHIEVKHENLRYACTYSGCDKVFQNSVSLRNHRYTHTSMPFKCNHCDKEFPQKNKLKVHLRHKHDIDCSLQELEEMRQFNIIRTRHAFVKVQSAEVETCSQGREDSSDVDVEAE